MGAFRVCCPDSHPRWKPQNPKPWRFFLVTSLQPMVPRPCQWWSWWRAHLEGWREVWTCTPGSLNKVLAWTGRHCTMNNGYLLLEVSYCYVVPSLVHLMQLKLSLVCPALLFQFFPQRYVLLPQVVVRLFLQSLLTETNNSCWVCNCSLFSLEYN